MTGCGQRRFLERGMTMERRYLASLPTRRKVMVPQKRRARICTGRWRSSSVYQIQMLPRFFTTPASAVGCTRTVLKVPSVVLISSRPSTFMVTGTLCIASTTGITKFLPTSMRLRRGVEDAGEQVGHAAGDRRLNVLGLSGDQILLIEDGLGLGVVDPERRVDLPAALDGLLVEFVGAALGAIESWTGNDHWHERAY